ncbi:MAG: M16 family metallopeptidase [Anaerovoracaceae bacterium]
MVVKRKLSNGIRVVIEPISHVQSAAMGIWVRAGSIDENEKNSGISHFIEHMMFKGTENRSAKRIAEDIDWIGGHINAFTGKEATCYYVKVLGSNLYEACDVVTDMFLKSQFDPVEMEKEKDVIYEEIKMLEDSPEDDVHDILGEAVFRGTLLERPVIGTPQSLYGINREDILSYIDREYTADHIVVAVAGAVDPDRFCQYFEEKLQGLTRFKSEKSKPEFLKIPEFNVKVKDVEQSHICIGLPSVELDGPLYYPMILLSSIMGGSMSSRLFQKVREEKGLAYSVYSISHSYVDTGIFSIYAGVSHKKVEEAMNAIKGELEALKRGGVTADELHKVKEQMKSSFIFGQESVNSRMFSIGRSELLLSRIRSPQETLEKIDAVTMDDIAAVAAGIVDVERYSVALITNKDRDLKKMM